MCVCIFCIYMRICAYVYFEIYRMWCANTRLFETVFLCLREKQSELILVLFSLFHHWGEIARYRIETFKSLGHTWIGHTWIGVFKSYIMMENTIIQSVEENSFQTVLCHFFWQSQTTFRASHTCIIIRMFGMSLLFSSHL